MSHLENFLPQMLGSFWIGFWFLPLDMRRNPRETDVETAANWEQQNGMGYGPKKDTVAVEPR